MTRAEKRKARVERKAAEKAAKMADIERLKRLKMAEFAEKLERIRRTCGDGIAMEAKINMSMGEAHDPPMNEVNLINYALIVLFQTYLVLLTSSLSKISNYRKI